MGELLFKAAKDIVELSSPLGVLPIRESLSPRENNSRIVMSYALTLVTRGDEYNLKAEKELFNSGSLDVFLPKFAADFLERFPTLSAAIEKFNRKFALPNFFSQDTQATIDQILSMTIEEAGALVKAKPLMEHWKNEFASLDKLKEDKKKPKKNGKIFLRHRGIWKEIGFFLPKW